MTTASKLLTYTLKFNLFAKHEVKQASSRFLFFRWDIAILIPGLTSPHANQVSGDTILQGHCGSIQGEVPPKTIVICLKSCQIFFLSYPRMRIGAARPFYSTDTALWRHSSAPHQPTQVSDPRPPHCGATALPTAQGIYYRSSENVTKPAGSCSPQ